MTLTPLALFGTDEPPPERQTLRAGPLSAMLEAGQLRDIRWHGVEAVRGLAYLLRDAAWGTLDAPLADLDILQGEDGFLVVYTGRSESPSGRLSFRARIEGQTKGFLVFEVEAAAETDFLTNRVGFVLLHPDEVAGQPLKVGHSDGSVEATSFPRRVSPDQPAFDIISLEHEPAPGMSTHVEFQGGIWEMEDQRNWSDASFKTYVRPLAWPRPYVIPNGTVETQRVVLRISGTPRAARTPAASFELPSQPAIPPLYLRLADGVPVPDRLPLPELAQGLILRIRGEAPDLQRLGAAEALAMREGMLLAVEAIFPQRNAEDEAAACLAALEGRRIEALLVAAARDFKTRASGTMPAGEVPLDETLAVLRRSFAGRIGTGTPAFFTEFNRNPPPGADFGFFGINPIVHAADDLSVMETLRTHPTIMDSAAALLPGVRFWPGPMSLAPNLNPYGPSLVQTDGRTRTCLAERDPRHGALFGAAYLLAAVAGVLPWAEVLAPLHANGATGLMDAEGRPYPLAFVHAELAAAQGAAVEPVSSPPALARLGWSGDGRRTVLVANLGTEPKQISLEADIGSVDRLAPGPLGWEPVQVIEEVHTIGPYETIRLRGNSRALR